MRTKLNPNVEVPEPSGDQLFGAPRPVTPLNPDGKHKGTDFAYPVGTELQNPYGWATAEWYDSPGLGGIEFWLNFDDGSQGRATHLSERMIASGRRIAPGIVFAKSGATGNAEGANVHWQFKPAGGTWQDDLAHLTISNNTDMVSLSGQIIPEWNCPIRDDNDKIVGNAVAGQTYTFDQVRMSAATTPPRKVYRVAQNQWLHQYDITLLTDSLTGLADKMVSNQVAELTAQNQFLTGQVKQLQSQSVPKTSLASILLGIFKKS